MTESELLETLSQNIKFYRKGKFTQETHAEEIGVSAQNINNVEGKRRFPRTENLIKIADALGVEVYQLFIPQNKSPIIIEETPENERIRTQITEEVVNDVRRILNKTLDKIK
ncbi:MAG: helix-turn-helix transcriptional regulator [Treponema sp.]|uniref:helix-turn-helix domain-containing protein n=1 Tax=Treponema sp. TaxID=166 RepID=UPI0025F8C785|nr:helix-turn-helix transcriptional regulator [Treponema sp.]MBQ8678511.1 helix-turn-helix transcriptional regulator [Treponema sp.]